MIYIVGTFSALSLTRLLLLALCVCATWGDRLSTKTSTGAPGRNDTEEAHGVDNGSLIAHCPGALQLNK